VLSLQGFQNAYAGVTVVNQESRAFHEAMGFEYIGTFRQVTFKDGVWLDLDWFGRSLGSHPPDPLPPIPLPDLVGTEELEQALRVGRSAGYGAGWGATVSRE
jgi:hypothetical protein